MKTLIFSLLFTFAFAGCKSGTSPTDEITAPTVAVAHIDYSGARNGSLSLTGTDSLVTIVKINDQNPPRQIVELVIARDTSPGYNNNATTGIEIILDGLSPFTVGQNFSEADSNSYATAAIGFSSNLGNDSLGPGGSMGLPSGPNVFFARNLTVGLMYASDDTSGVALVGTFSGTFMDTTGHLLSVSNGSFSIPKFQ
ncbi:MAG: hypothetical protein ACHQNE_00405 [Candidatus Kapaibacterium sp.]